jgi:hypothetical protein
MRVVTASVSPGLRESRLSELLEYGISTDAPNAVGAQCRVPRAGAKAAPS